MAEKLKRGSAGRLGLTVSSGKEALTAEDLALIHCIEFSIGETIQKKWPDEVTFADGKFHVPYTQAETLSFEEGDTVEVDVRVHFIGDEENVVGIEADWPKLKVVKTLSEERL